MFNNNTQTFTLYNYGTGTATISSLAFVTAAGTLHQADLSGFDASAVKPYTNPSLTGLAVSLAPSAGIPFTLDYDNSNGDLTTYDNILTVYGTVNGFPDQASLDANVIVSSTPVGDPGGIFDGGGGGGDSGPAACADSNSCSADGGGGGGGGGKVICTALYELGLMDKDIYEYDQAFGVWLYQNNPVAYKGYRMWADILVAYVKGEGRPLLPKLMFWKTREEQQAMSQRIAIAVAQFVGSAFAKEIARRAGHDLPRTLRGWITVSLGLAVCKGIGFIFAKTKKYKELTQ